ncbi:MAG: DUF2817 domain-containing protein [Gammaproteobacteria bacterium]
MRGDSALRPSYREARELFCGVAQAEGFAVARYPLADLAGLEGEDLSIDVATRGTGNCLVLLSGVHGVEGFAGSACQIECMRRVEFSGLRIVLIHALNPYGFSFSSRVNENRVDLNRNFEGRYPADYNARYSDLHAMLMEIIDGARIEPPTRSAIAAWLTYWERKLGRAECLAVITGGQFRHPDGLFYGGRELQPSVRLLERIFAAHCGLRTARALTLDFHTGLGPPGNGELIYTGGAKDRACELARSWLADRVTCPERGDSVSREVRGAAQTFFVREHLAQEGSYAALEFGTVPIEEMIAALCEDIWLRARSDVDPCVAEKVRADVRAAFRPEQSAWEAAILHRAVQVVSRAAASLRS